MNEVFYTETIRHENNKADCMGEQSAKRMTRPKKNGLVIAACIISVLCGGMIGLGIGIGIPLSKNVIIPYFFSAESSGTAAVINDPVQDASGFSFEAVVSHEQIMAGFGDAIQKIAPSTVCITSVSQNAEAYFFGVPFESTSAGTGVIFHETEDNIYIVTNCHVIDGASDVSISVSGSEPVTVLLVGKDQDADLAVLSAFKEDLKSQGITSVALASFGDSAQLRIGDFVISTGNGLGEGLTATLGIVSAKDREVVIDGRTHKVIQTDSRLITGFSGGPLINLNGEVIGINTARLSQINGDMGYSITSNSAKPIIESLMNQKPKPFLGIEGQDITDEIAEEYNVPKYGVLIRSVISGSSAEKAGIMRNDIITSFNGMTIQTFEQLSEAISECEVGDTVEVKVLRDGKGVNLTVTLMAYNISF